MYVLKTDGSAVVVGGKKFQFSQKVFQIFVFGKNAVIDQLAVKCVLENYLYVF